MFQPPTRLASVPSLGTLLALLMWLPVTSASAQQRDVNYDEAKVPAYQLPDPLRFSDDSPVATPEAWTQRRGELLELFREHMYGRALLERPPLRFEILDHDPQALAGQAIRQQVRLFFSQDRGGPHVDVLLFLPANSAAPVPVFVGLNFQGNHTVHPDPKIRLPESWVRNNEATGVSDHQPQETGRGASASRWPVEAILQRGYGLVTAYYGDIDPDFDDGFQNGVHRLQPATEAEPYSTDAWGSIATWAWGLSYIMDYVQADASIDPNRVCLMGHSRLGKTALWAGAEDTRFALVISNNSGCGGAALSRRQFGETVAIINNAFPHWFCDRFLDYSGHEDQLPIDQHELIALIAPRPVYVASAQDDRWADPRGEFLAAVNASPVYRLLGTDGIASTTYPEVHQPIHSTIGYHVRAGKHDVTRYDWDQWMDFADRHLR